MGYLTQEDLEKIRIDRRNGSTTVFVYQTKTTEQLYAKGEWTLADKLALEFGSAFIVEHRRTETPIDDGLTVQERYDILKFSESR
jgi:hypothetical protein